MHLVFVNRFFHPDHSATSQILTDLCFTLAARGHKVHVALKSWRQESSAFHRAKAAD